jgi:hypothetical protein
MWVRLPPLLLLTNGQCVTALFLSQGDKMPRKMSIRIDLVRDVSEVWVFEIKDSDNPEEIFNEIKNNPNTLWMDYDSNLMDSEYFDETVTQVVNYEVE